jgi:mono/diheme cytochrome c family protein
MNWISFAGRSIITGTICLVAILSAAVAQTIPGRPNPDQGAQLASKLCVNCHLIGQESQAQSRVKADVPSFREIANLDGQTSERLTVLIISPNHPMPTIALSRDDIAHVVAYIETFKTEN